MKRPIIVGVVVLLVALGGGGVWLYNLLLGPPATASGPVSAVPLAQSGGSGADTLVFQIVPEKSEVRFTIPEVLRGRPNDVVGKTNQVAGQIGVSPTDLSVAKIGVIQVDARTLATDDDRRNRMIQNRILDTGSFEFITLSPTEIRGLNGKAELGKPLTFQVAGNLTIRDVSKPVVFDVTARADSPTQMSGTATTTINKSDFQLQIPSVPFVANVGEQVKLDVDFVAEAVQK